jgi:hypothetical protein
VYVYIIIIVFVVRNISFFCNLSAAELAKNPVHHSRTKHVAKKYHMIRQLVNLRVVIIAYVRSEENIADVFTKAVGSYVIIRFQFMIMGGSDIPYSNERRFTIFTDEYN